MKKTLLVALFALVGLTAGAGTIGLWTFEGGTVGATADAIVNQANPGVLDGSTVAYGSGPKPVYSADIPGSSLYTSFADTVADINAGSLQFTGSRGSNGYVSIADDGNLTRPASVTVECFFKANPSNTWHSLITKAIPSDITKMSWALRIDNVNYLFATISSPSGANVTLSSGVNVADGQWHHAALTIDGTTGAAILYLDYTPVKTGTVPVPLYYAASPIAIGANPYNTQCYNGSIDSVRVSDTVLPPAEFMTVYKGNPQAFAYLPSDGTAGILPAFALNKSNPLLNALSVSANGGTKPAFSNDVPASIIYDGLFGPEFASPNPGSLFFTGSIMNALVGGYLSLADTNSPTFCSGDFTLEGFFRATPEKRTALGASSTQTIFRRLNSTNVAFATSINTSGALASTFYFSNGAFAQITSPYNVDDSRWHHVAQTYNATTRTQKLYLDGSLIGQTVHTLPIFTNSAVSSIFIGGYSSGAGLRGWMDEVRLTTAELVPTQFLSVVQLPAGTLPGAFWPMDGTANSTVGDITNNLSVALAGYGGLNTTTGTLPVYSNETVAPLIYDGLGGSVWNAANRGSISFTKLSDTRGGFIRIPDPVNLSTTDGVTSNFTAELFFKCRSRAASTKLTLIYKNNVRGGAWGLNLNEAGRLSMTVYTATATVTLDSLALLSTSRFDDNVWHHAAFTYDGTTRRAAIYIDNRLAQASILSEPLLLDGGDILLGGRGGTSPLDGLLDEVRITPAVLAPEQFLTTTAPVATGTVAYWSFDDGVASGTPAINVPGLYPALNLYGYNTLPVYTNDFALSVNRNRIYDKADGDFLHLNGSAMALQNSRLSCPDNPTLRAATNLTVEFFLKADVLANHNTGIIRKNYDGANPMWSLSTVTNNGILQLNSRFAGTVGTYTNNNQTYAVDYRLNDGKWHHIAMTYDSSISTAVFYIDYVKRGERTVLGALMTGPGELWIGTSGNYYFEGLVDEIRISNVLLAPEQFLRAYAPGGTRIIFR